MHRVIYSFDCGITGGVRNYSHNLVRALNTLPNTVAVGLSLQNTSSSEKKRLRGCYKGSQLDVMVTIHALFSKLQISDNDIIILHDASTIEYFRKRRFTTTLWIVLHGDYDYYVNTARRYSLWADRTFAVSQNLCCTVERIFKHKIKCYYCPPIVIPPFAPDFNRKQNQAIFIGRHTKEKGAHLLSEVDHILRRKGIAIKWLLITSGKFDEKIRNKNLEWEDNCDGVQVLENLTNSNIFSHLESSTFFILPSIAEGFPVSLIEAYSQGCIPIVFRYGKDVTNHIPCEFHENIIEDGSALGIAQRIEEILVNDSIHGFYEISQDWFKSNHTLNSDNLHKLTLCGREKRLKSPLKFFAYQVMRKIFEPSKENPRNSWF